MTPLFCTAIALLLVSPVPAQQIATVDLTHAPEVDQERKEIPHPPGCEKLIPGVIADGYVESEDNKPRQIVLEITKISSNAPTVGSELQAEVRLRNSGKQPIQIPWGTNWRQVIEGEDPGRIEWDGGDFEVLLRGEQENNVLLESLTYSLYGSKSSPGSLITIQPGEWVIAEIKFKLLARYAFGPGSWKAGKMQLIIEWRQTLRLQDVIDCRVNDRYYRYSYQQEQVPFTIQITVETSSTKPN